MGKLGLYHKPIFSSKTFSEQRQNTERKTEWVDGRRNWMSEEEPARFQFVSGSGHLFVFLLAPGKLSITTNTEFLQIFFYSSNDQLTKCKTCLHRTRHKRPRVNDRRWYCNTLFTKIWHRWLMVDQSITVEIKYIEGVWWGKWNKKCILESLQRFGQILLLRDVRIQKYKANFYLSARCNWHRLLKLDAWKLDSR